MNIIGISGLHNSVPFKKRSFPDLTPRQYRIAQGLDSAAALVTDNGIAAAAQERFSREKGTGAFPADAIRYCLQSANLTYSDLDYVAHGFSYEPFRSLFEGSDGFNKTRFRDVYSRDVLLRNVQEHLPGPDWDHKVAQVQHHLAHAASAFYLSGFQESLILVVDGMGEIHSTTVAVGEGNRITIVRQIPALHSLGILYGIFTLYLGFWMNFDEYKVMGLAAYGNPPRYYSRIQNLIHFKDDGTYSIPILFENTTLEERETYSGTLSSLSNLFGPARLPGTEITQDHRDIAAALQAVLEASLIRILRYSKKETGQKNLCMAGGVALNCKANGVIKRSKIFKQVFVQPASGDDGTSLGAALYIQHQHDPSLSFSKMGLPFWGPGYGQEDIENALRTHSSCESMRFSCFDDLAAEAARRIALGQIVGWFQGRMEFGPRALGNRSILVDPRDSEMRDRLNKLVKKREEFRPFAPAVPAEVASHFFEIDPGDEADFAHMLYVTQVRSEYRDRLPAVTHLDGSARLQTVSKDENHRFWRILDEFGKISGIPVLLNTSLNVRGQPIVCTPVEAVDTFLSAQLDALVIGDCLVTRRARDIVKY